MKRVTLVLSGKIEDPENGRDVYLSGATLQGTPLQAALLFECLFSMPGKADLFVPDKEARDILNVCKDTLKNVRESQKSVDSYDDPDLSEEDAPYLELSGATWSIKES